ncbi:hypothetical protein RIF29_16954 [Crotalaria pallida]|uniref:Uncharacterized protein n=1 Tax=Crotalaria pallida TaxID=3830 RepID=A0AAN9IEX1_CROPI
MVVTYSFMLFGHHLDQTLVFWLLLIVVSNNIHCFRGAINSRCIDKWKGWFRRERNVFKPELCKNLNCTLNISMEIFTRLNYIRINRSATQTN